MIWPKSLSIEVISYVQKPYLSWCSTFPVNSINEWNNMVRQQYRNIVVVIQGGKLNYLQSLLQTCLFWSMKTMQLCIMMPWYTVWFYHNIIQLRWTITLNYRTALNTPVRFVRCVYSNNISCWQAYTPPSPLFFSCHFIQHEHLVLPLLFFMFTPLYIITSSSACFVHKRVASCHFLNVFTSHCPFISIYM